MIKILDLLTNEGKDEKLNIFADRFTEAVQSGNYGKKILVFSFFSDTIEYLKDCLPPLLAKKIPNFRKQSAFVSGNDKEVEIIAKKFSPISKNII